MAVFVVSGGSWQCKRVLRNPRRAAIARGRASNEATGDASVPGEATTRGAGLMKLFLWRSRPRRSPDAMCCRARANGCFAIRGETYRFEEGGAKELLMPLADKSSARKASIHTRCVSMDRSCFDDALSLFFASAHPVRPRG